MLLFFFTTVQMENGDKMCKIAPSNRVPAVDWTKLQYNMLWSDSCALWLWGRLCPQTCCELTLFLLRDDARSPCIHLVYQSSTHLSWLLTIPSSKQLLIAVPESLIAFSSTITKPEEEIDNLVKKRGKSKL